MEECLNDNEKKNTNCLQQKENHKKTQNLTETSQKSQERK